MTTFSAEEKAQDGVSLITKDFALAEHELAGVKTWYDLKKELTRIVQYLIDKDLNRLINIIYRIDIPQSKFEAVLTNEKPDAIASTIAQLILEREQQKIIMRQRYRNVSS